MRVALTDFTLLPSMPRGLRYRAWGFQPTALTLSWQYVSWWMQSLRHLKESMNPPPPSPFLHNLSHSLGVGNVERRGMLRSHQKSCVHLDLNHHSEKVCLNSFGESHVFKSHCGRFTEEGRGGTYGLLSLGGKHEGADEAVLSQPVKTQEAIPVVPAGRPGVKQNFHTIACNPAHSSLSNRNASVQSGAGNRGGGHKFSA